MIFKITEFLHEKIKTDYTFWVNLLDWVEYFKLLYARKTMKNVIAYLKALTIWGYICFESWYLRKHWAKRNQAGRHTMAGCSKLTSEMQFITLFLKPVEKLGTFTKC